MSFKLNNGLEMQEQSTMDGGAINDMPARTLDWSPVGSR